MFGNDASGPEISLPGWILVGLLPETHRNRPSGRPKAGRRAHFGAFPITVLPKSGPEGRFTARKHYCITYNTIPNDAGLGSKCFDDDAKLVSYPMFGNDLAGLRAKIKTENFKNRAGIGPTPKISLGK